jgi:hypothetical protein
MTRYGGNRRPTVARIQVFATLTNPVFWPACRKRESVNGRSITTRRMKPESCRVISEVIRVIPELLPFAFEQLVRQMMRISRT